jgi:hypothetical protein
MALDLLDHADALVTINTNQDAQLARDVSNMFAATGGQKHGTHLMLPQILDVHADMAATMTAAWYDDIDPGARFKAKPYAEIPEEQVSKVIDWALHAPGEQPPQERLIQSSQRLVRNVSRNTVARNADKEGVRYARHAKEDACPYCKALAMRGAGREDRKWLYDTEEAATTRKKGGSYHTNCGCVAVPIRAGQIWTPPSYTADWDKQYREAAKATKQGPKYFQRIVAQMRSNEDAAKAAAEAEAEQDAEVIALPTTPDPARAAARAELDAATDLAAVRKAAAKVLPDTRVNISHDALLQSADMGSRKLWDRKAPLVAESVKAMVQAADDIMTKYPELDLESLKDDSAGDHTYALTRTTPGHTGQQVVFNRKFLVNPAHMADEWERGLSTGFHYEGTENPVYDIMIHEMGHVMQRTAEDRGVFLDDNDVTRALARHFYDNVDDVENPDVVVQVGTGGRWERYRNWLLDNLSGYSWRNTSTSDAPGQSTVNVREALAEAFADVEVNGEDAHETSIVLHALLVSAYTQSVEGGSTHGMAPAV